MNNLIMILASVTVVSLLSLIGIIFVGLKESWLRRILMLLVGFSSGTLLGGAFLHLLPEATTSNGTTTFYYVVLGIVSFFALEKFFYWRHCHEEECPVHMFVYLNLIGDGIHNFIDGMIMAATYIVSYQLGFVTTLAVIFHEIPQEIGDFGILVYGGLSKKKALIYNLLDAMTAFVGALVAYFLISFQSLGGSQNIEFFLVPFAAGGFIYIAATDLMPELHKKSQAGASLIQLVSIIVGIGLMAYFKTFVGV